MKAAKLFSILVVVLIGIYGAIGLYFLPMAGFQGNLTRMGLLPESLFGWNKPQPELDVGLFEPVSWKDADVLVIGDSFSDGRVWQTVLVRQGLRVRTLHWTSVRGICENFYPWVRAQGFKGKWIVFEMVELNIEEGVPKTANCKEVVYHPSVLAELPRNSPLVSRGQTNLSGRLSVGIETALGALYYRRISMAPDFKSAEFSNGAKLARVNRGCELFSHERCNDVLFLNGDRAADVNSRILDDVEKINARLNDITPIWAFVPNKSTAYLYPDKQFWNEAERRVHAPNLLRMTQQAIRNKTVDLYPANDTHFSTTAYLLMGEEILKTMQQAGLNVPPN
jgi:hypothetical protein